MCFLVLYKVCSHRSVHFSLRGQSWRLHSVCVVVWYSSVLVSELTQLGSFLFQAWPQIMWSLSLADHILMCSHLPALSEGLFVAFKIVKVRRKIKYIIFCPAKSYRFVKFDIDKYISFSLFSHWATQRTGVHFGTKYVQ